MTPPREDEVVLVDTDGGEVIEVPTSAVMVRPTVSVAAANPVWDIGALSDDEFAERQRMLTAGVRRIAELQRSILVEDKDGKGRNGDWGRIPGVDRAIIYKSGAEKLDAFYRLVPDFGIKRDERQAAELGFQSDGDRPNRITYTVRCDLHAGSVDGPIVGQGVGVCSSWEKKYLYRSGGHVCPSCGKATLRLGDKRGTTAKEWYCWQKVGISDGCGSRFPQNDPQISAGAADVLNQEPWDLENTLVKIAAKRAHVDATLRTLGASALFTQDIEEGGAAYLSHDPDHDTPEPAGRQAKPDRSIPASPPFTPLVRPQEI